MHVLFSQRMHAFFALTYQLKQRHFINHVFFLWGFFFSFIHHFVTHTSFMFYHFKYVKLLYVFHWFYLVLSTCLCIGFNTIPAATRGASSSLICSYVLLLKTAPRICWKKPWKNLLKNRRRCLFAPHVHHIVQHLGSFLSVVTHHLHPPWTIEHTSYYKTNN